MTRAKGLLCLAIPKNLVTEKQCQELKDLGWNIEKVIEKVTIRAIHLRMCFR